MLDRMSDIICNSFNKLSNLSLTCEFLLHNFCLKAGDFLFRIKKFAMFIITLFSQSFNKIVL